MAWPLLRAPVLAPARVPERTTRVESRPDVRRLVLRLRGAGPPFPSAAFYDPGIEGPFDAPANPLLIRGDPDLNTSIDRWLSLVDLVFIVALFVLVTRHWRRSGRYARRALVPVFVVAGVGVGALLVGAVIGLKSQVSILNWGVQLTLLLLPVGFLVGLLRSRLARASVADLVINLETARDPAGIRVALARALGDPALEVGYWLPTKRTFVDAEGGVVEDSPSLPGRTTTIVHGADGPVAVLTHDAALVEEPELVDAVAATARLALENQRLHAELRAQLDEVRASRARIVAAGDAERRRLERDLHDGAQQRLLALGLALQLARAELPEGTASADELLADAEQELQEALHELRELARGIHPAILTDGGLTPALRTLAERTPIPVSVVATDRRFPPAVETAAYFIVSEALANVVKHAHASHASVAVSADAEPRGDRDRRRRRGRCRRRAGLWAAWPSGPSERVRRPPVRREQAAGGHTRPSGAAVRIVSQTTP